MPQTLAADTETDERATVDAWREESLLAAGFPEAEAAELAYDHAVDVHQAVALLAADCPLALAMRILR